MNTLMRHDLLDELRLWVHPVVTGRGKRLFDDRSNATLKLVGTTTFSSGVVILACQPAGEAGPAPAGSDDHGGRSASS